MARPVRISSDLVRLRADEIRAAGKFRGLTVHAGSRPPVGTIAFTRAVALRRFAPRSYLGDADAIAAGIAANASLPIIFEVIDPGANASGFEFSFLPGPNLAEDPQP